MILSPSARAARGCATFGAVDGGGGLAGGGCAIVGGAFYDPPTAQFPSPYVGKYFYEDLCGGWIHLLDPASPATATAFATALSQPVDLTVGPDGSLYALEHAAGTVQRISYSSVTAVPVSR